MTSVSRIAALVALVVGVVPLVTAKSSLNMGSSAPEIKVARWVKGTPVKIEKGKIYVVEFWATWCGPCKTSIPHLTELAKKYAGKATFTGVSVYEKNQPKGEFATYGDKVANFVKEWGDKMDYNVCWDGDDNVMGKSWMEAAGQQGIPTAFVIDRDSKIAWIGHPMAGLDEVVGKVIDGTYDMKSEMDRQAKQREMQQKMAEKVSPFMKLAQAGKFPEAVEAMDKAFAADSDLEKGYGMMKFQLLGMTDGAKASTYGKSLADGLYKDNPQMLNSIAWAMVDDKKPMKGADLKVAVSIAERAVEATKDGDPQAAYNLDTLAFCYFKDGQIDKAITTQEKALKVADATKGFDAATHKDIADRLEMFKQKKGG